MKKIIITNRTTYLEKINETRDCLDERFIEYFHSLGYFCFPIPNYDETANIQSFVRAIEPKVIVLSGGNSIAPSFYRKEDMALEDTSLKRDRNEQEIITVALKAGIPVFGICRGMQMINVYFGGGLKNIRDEIKSNVNHVATTHAVRFIKEDRDFNIHINKNIVVNSFHKHGLQMDMLGDGLEPLALASDQTVEMIRHKRYPVMGVLWHPERPDSDKLFDEALIKGFFR